MKYEDATKEQLINIIKEYMEPNTYRINDFDYIINNAQVNTERNVVTFTLNGFTLILDTRDLSYVDAHPGMPIGSNEPSTVQEQNDMDKYQNEKISDIIELHKRIGVRL